MPLFAVERDLSQVPPEQLRSTLQGLVVACARLEALGKKVRYISSAVFPGEARGLCLFGAEQPQWIQEVNEAARIPYSRIYAVLDLTPTGVRRDLSRGRWPARVDAPVAGRSRARPSHRRPARVAEDLARWAEEARGLVHVLGGCLDDAGRLQAEVVELERERTALADEVRRLGWENEQLRAERDDLSAAIQTIAGQTASTVDELLSRMSGRRGTPEDRAER